MNFGADGAGTLYITGVFDPNKAPFPAPCIAGANDGERLLVLVTEP